ncbi:MAG: fibronectin type III domain-containing protein [Opitutaceae bacterium]|nr:fibronectin type III domain-containing protein [Opitutaceae bacterium]
MRHSLFLASLIGLPIALIAHDDHDHASWQPERYPDAAAHAPRPLPDRVVLTWDGDPATSQAVTWRTDPSIERAVAELALANDLGRALVPTRFDATTVEFTSDLSTAHYHSVSFRDLAPDTLYTYRVGDGVNWSEWFHFRTAAREARRFSFIYFGDAQNDIRTHWSRVFREAFREAPRAAFTLHAGDLINEDASDAEWGEWHGAPAWVNGTIPVVATPGNHEYYRANAGPEHERFWRTKDGKDIAVDLETTKIWDDAGKVVAVRVVARTAEGRSGELTHDTKRITAVDAGITALTGFAAADLVGTEPSKHPLRDRPRDPGVPAVSQHWRPQFAFPVQDIPAGLEETCYSIDYQGARIIALDSNQQQEAQVAWLRRVLAENRQRWTILTFHHPIFSPAKDRDNASLRAVWKPVFDEFRVDLVLTGHDHTYARTGRVDGRVRVGDTNVSKGYTQAYDPEIGTVYVVSVSGPKMYDITDDSWAVRMAEDTQLFQVITVDGDTLHFEARTATNRLYDAFTLRKRAGQPNELVEVFPPENRRPRAATPAN